MFQFIAIKTSFNQNPYILLKLMEDFALKEKDHNNNNYNRHKINFSQKKAKNPQKK